MSVTYYVALPFVDSEEGPRPGEAKECHSEPAAIRTAEVLARKEPNIGALAFRRSGEPKVGSFADAVILKSFGLVPENLDEF